MQINIDSKKLINLDLFSYFICYCLYKNDPKSLEEYCKINPISEKSIENAISNGYLSSDRKIGDDFYVSNISLNSKFQEEFFPISTVISFEEAYKMLKEHYPRKVVCSDSSIRHLHTDNDRCIRLFKDIILVNGVVDTEKLSFILQCVNYIVNTATRGRKLGYMQMLVTFLHQKGWESVSDDVMEIIKTKGSINKIDEDNNGERFEAI